MSTVSVHLSARQVSDVSALVGSATEARLADLVCGMTCRIVGMDPGVEPSTARRLSDLGFAPGGEVTMLRRAPMGDPAIFRVAGCEVALRKAQAAGIRVQRLS
jgi:ferrous iron transport protein A